MSFRLRRASVDDLDGVMAIETSVFANDAWSRDGMAHELASRDGFYLVATPDADDTRIVGLQRAAGAAGGSRRRRPDHRRAARGAGGGARTALMGQMIAEARRRGVREVFLEVRADNPAAQSLYESLGFEGIAVRPRYYMPDGVDAVVMRLRVPATTTPAGRRPRGRDDRTSESGSAVTETTASSTARRRRARAPVVLGIETSCDETGVGIVRGTELLANVIASSMDEHARYGGVVPEVAARAHLEAMEPALRAALAEAGRRRSTSSTRSR